MIDLLQEEFEPAIGAYVPTDSSLMVRRLADWRHVLCCSPSYLETHPEPMSPADHSAHNCIRHAYYPCGYEWRVTNPEGGGGGTDKGVNASECHAIVSNVNAPLAPSHVAVRCSERADRSASASMGSMAAVHPSQWPCSQTTHPPSLVHCWWPPG